MTLIAERGLYTCDTCQRKLPREAFCRGRSYLDSDTGRWYCDECGPPQCPDCGLLLRPSRVWKHRCHVPPLREAMGVELTRREQRLIGWLASSIDAEHTQVLCELFRRMRAHQPAKGDQ